MKTEIKTHKFTATVEILDFLDSTWIQFVKFDPTTLKMDVTTRTGAVYRYQGIGTDEFARLICAESSGSYFNDRIKGQYRSKKLRKGA